MFALPEDEGDPVLLAGITDVASAAPEHLGADVDAHDRRAGLLGQLERDTCRSGGDVEDRPAAHR